MPQSGHFFTFIARNVSRYTSSMSLLKWIIRRWIRSAFRVSFSESQSMTGHRNTSFSGLFNTWEQCSVTAILQYYINVTSTFSGAGGLYFIGRNCRTCLWLTPRCCTYSSLVVINALQSTHFLSSLHVFPCLVM